MPRVASVDPGEKVGMRGSQVLGEEPREAFPQGHSLSAAAPQTPHTVRSARMHSPQLHIPPIC